jgi:hypothetical protein
MKDDSYSLSGFVEGAVGPSHRLNRLDGYEVREWWHELLRLYGKYKSYAIFLVLPSDKEAIEYLTSITYLQELNAISGDDCLVTMVVDGTIHDPLDRFEGWSVPNDSSSIPPYLYDELFYVLSACGPFATDRELRAIFADETLSPWRNRLPEVDNPYERVTGIIDLLHNQHNKSGENALVLFLRMLSEGFDPRNHCHQDLAYLTSAFEREVESRNRANAERWDYMRDGLVRAVHQGALNVLQDGIQSARFAQLFDIDYAALPCLVIFERLSSSDFAVVSLKNLESDKIAEEMRELFTVLHKATLEKVSPLEAIDTYQKRRTASAKSKVIIGVFRDLTQKTIGAVIEASAKAFIK